MKNISFLEEHGVDISRSLDLFGDVETYNETLNEFLVGIHSKITKLIELLEKKDMANYAIYVHSMKNDAKNFGFTNLANIALEHEQKSKVGDYYYISTHINDLINETNSAILLIQDYMGSDDYDNSVKSIEIDPKDIDISKVKIR